MKTQTYTYADFTTQLRKAGFRMTASRKAIARVLSSAEHWLNPDEILLRGREYCPSLGLVTVYRTLTLFTELGLVSRIHAHPGCHGYVTATLEHGHHLVCRRCQQVVEFPGSDALAPFIKAIEEKTGFTIDDHMLELHGLCPACQVQTQSGTHEPHNAKEFLS